MVVPVEAYASFVPRQIVDRLTVDPLPPSAPREEHFTAALLFADVAGFTRITKRLAGDGPAGTERLIRILNSFFGSLIEVVELHGGDVLKFAGDALLAVWRVSGPSDLPTAAAQAVHCGLRAQAVLEGFEAEGERLRLRISVHGGPVRQMDIGGVFNRWESVVVGEPLIELCGPQLRADVGEVAVSPVVWRSISDRFDGQENGHGAVVARSAREPWNQPLSSQRSFWPELPPTIVDGLRAFIPKAILDRIASGQWEWLAEMRPASVLFVHLPRFAAEADCIDLKAAQAVMERLQSAIYRYEGSLNKLSVDDKGVTLVAALGLPPLAHVDDPFRAVQTAAALRVELQELGQPISGIGIATGRVFCGAVGSNSRREYTMIGDPVNLAARLMQVADACTLCDAATRDACADRYQFRGPLTVSLPLKKFSAIAYEPETPIECDRQLEPGFVGRKQERQVVAEALSLLAEQGIGGTLLLEGDSGLGKSRLIDELVAQARRLDLRPLCGGGDAIERAVPYRAWQPIVAELFSISEGSDAANSSMFGGFLPASAQLADLRPLLNMLLPNDVPENDTTRQMDAASRADNTQRTVVRFLRNAAQSQRLVVVLDDAQWLDSASWAVLRRLMLSEVLPLLLVIATRPFTDQTPDVYEALRSRPGTQTLRLGPLTQSECAELVRARFGVELVPAPVLDWLYRRSEGHPFYCEELATLLRDSGRVAVVDGRCELRCPPSDLESLQFPEALSGVITSRLDRLSPEEQIVVKTASVIGRVFEFRILEQAYPFQEDRAQLPQHLARLVERDVTVPLNRPEPAHSFKHVLIQEVAYNLMLGRQRQELHRAVAACYEAEIRDQSASDKVGATYPLLAHHWQHAGDADKTFQYQTLAGDFALRNAAYREAATFLSDALAGCSKLGRAGDSLSRASLERQLAEAYMGLGQLDEALACFQRALTALGEREPSGRVRSTGAIGCETLRHLSRVFRRGRAQLAEDGPLLEAARSYEHLAELGYLANDTNRFLYASLRMLTLAERAGLSPELARARANLGLTAGVIPWHSLARSQFRHAREAAKAVGHLPSQAWVSCLTGIYHVGIGEWEAARQQLHEASSLYQRLNDWRQFGSALSILGATHYFRGDFEGGLQVWTELHEAAARRGDVLQQAWGYGGRALNLLPCERAAEAAEMAETALEMFGTNSDRISEITTRGVLAVARLRLGDLDAAREAAQRTAEQIRQLGRPSSYYLLEGYSAVAEVRLAEWSASPHAPSDLVRAACAAVKTMERFARVYPIARPRLLRWQARAAELCGRKARALKLLDRAIVAAEDLEMTPDATAARQQRANLQLIGAV